MIEFNGAVKSVPVLLCNVICANYNDRHLCNLKISWGGGVIWAFPWLLNCST